MVFDSCINGNLFWITGLIVFLLSFFLFGYFAWKERKGGLDSRIYLKLGFVGWILNTISFSLIGLSTSGLDDSACVQIDNVSFFSETICPGMLAIVATAVLMAGVWVEKMRRLAKEQKDGNK